MERLWAPWRAKYLIGQGRGAEHGENEGQGGGGGAGACIFCTKPARGPAHHAEELILCATPDAFVIMNLYPYNTGHVMVVPRAHVASPAELSPAAHDALFRLVTASTVALGRAGTQQGMNLGMNLGQVAGAGIAGHCHVHLVPRWLGDNSFMPVLAETRVISEALQATYARLLPHFSPLSGLS
jgi:ATP adenylyltransferase